MTVPYNSVLVGKTLAESRISSAAGLIVMVLQRRNRTITLPSPADRPREPVTRLLIQGRLDRFNEMRQWSDLVIEREAPLMQTLLSGQVEARRSRRSPRIRRSSRSCSTTTDFRRRFMRQRAGHSSRDELIRRDNLAYVPIRAGDKLLLQGGEDIIVHELEGEPGILRHPYRDRGRPDGQLPAAGTHLSSSACRAIRSLGGSTLAEEPHR